MFAGRPARADSDMLMPEGEDGVGIARGTVDDRQTVRQAGTMPHPLRLFGGVKIGEHIARDVGKFVGAGEIGRSFQPGQFDRAGDPQSDLHRVHEDAAGVPHHRAVYFDPGIGKGDMIAALRLKWHLGAQFPGQRR